MVLGFSGKQMWDLNRGLEAQRVLGGLMGLLGEDGCPLGTGRSDFKKIKAIFKKSLCIKNGFA